MKTTLFLLILLSFTNILIVYAQWEESNNGLYARTIECFIANGNNIYAGTGWGIFVTSDNGYNWTAKNNGLKEQFRTYIETLAIDGNNIFAGTILYGIFLSIDKGENWVQKSNGLPYKILGLDTMFLYDVYKIIISGNKIFAGTSGGIYLSADNGENWTAKNNGLPQLDTYKRDIYSMTVIGNNIFAGTRFGVYMTSDNGNNWSPKNKGIENLTIYSLATNGNNIYAATCFGGIYLSTDNGNEWINIVRKDTCMDVLLIKEKYIFAAGGFYLSSDNGINWSTHENGLKELSILSMIINGDYIFAGTNSEGIFRAKLSDLGITDVKEPEQTNENIIYPNPASDEFRLRFHSPTVTTVQLSVFDLLGNCVLSRTEQTTEGTNEKTINCEKLPQGYYYVKININEIVETVPLVIIK